MLTLYLCLLIPSLLYYLYQVFIGGCDDIDDVEEGVKFSISSICYFLVGFGIGGILFLSFGILASIISAIIIGVLNLFMLKSLLKKVSSWCSNSEVTLPTPVVGDLCVTENNIFPSGKGTVKIIRTGKDAKEFTFFATVNRFIPINTQCVIMEVLGDTVLIEPNVK